MARFQWWIYFHVLENWIFRLYYFWVFYHKVLYNVEYNLYMILKMMCWLSFCLYFFITNFTIMVNDFELGVFCWDLIMLFFWCKFTMLKVIIMILKMVHVFGTCFCFLVTKFTIIIILVWDLMMNDEYSFYVLENGVLHRCLFWFKYE